MYRRQVIMSGALLIGGLTVCIPTNDTVLKHNKNHKLINFISKEYKQDYGKISNLINKVEEETTEAFPSKLDVLSIMAIESRFKASALNNSGAKGLMQIKYKIVNTDHENILAGIDLLITYKKLLGTEKAAIIAYNVGIGNYRDGVRNFKYYENYDKIKKELIKYEC